MQKEVYEIDGNRFSDLQGFFDEISEVVIPGAQWGRNLDAFDDVLSGGFGTPDEGFILVWRNSQESRRRLGHAETAKHLEALLRSCHPSSRETVECDRRKAIASEGGTIYDWLVEIIRTHCSGGSEEKAGVELRLE